MRAAAGVAFLALVPLAALLISAPRPDLKSYFQSGFTDTAYQQVCVNKVLKSWKSPPNWPKAGSKAVVQSTIGRDGALTEALLTMKSGSKEWDDAAFQAVRKASPFPPLPKGSASKDLQVHWHFSVLP